jgi:hypothetical protein
MCKREANFIQGSYKFIIKVVIEYINYQNPKVESKRIIEGAK